MKIDGPLRFGGATPRTGRAAAPRGPSAFAAHLVDDGAETTIGGAAATGRVQPLVSLQEVDDRPRRGQGPVDRGEALLDGLDGLRLAMLEGRVPAGRLQDLAKGLRHRHGATADPALQDVLDAIDLRVSVELAKRGLEV